MIFKVPESQTYTTIYRYAKIYPHVTKIFQYHTPITVKSSGWEEIKPQSKPKKPKTEVDQAKADIDSIRRTKTRLRDIILSNEFDLFCTFTFKSDRQNIERSKKKMQYWLDNSQKRYGSFDYVIVSEFHKDGVSIHFHALIKGYKGKLKDSGIIKKGRKIYNIKGYKSGHTTVSKISSEDYQRVASYISKYIQKDMPSFKNKRRYWCSQKLQRPKKIQNPEITSEHMQKFTDSYSNNRFTVYTLENPKNNNVIESQLKEEYY